MFRGRYEHTIDAKGRTSVPARYRDALERAGERRIVLTSALDPCLVAYAPPEWAAFEERLGKLPQFDPRGAEAEAHLRVGRGRVRDRRRRAASSSRPRCAITPAEERRPLGGQRPTTPSSGTRTSGSAHVRDDAEENAARSPRASRSSAYEQPAARPTGPVRRRVRRRVGVARGRPRDERREALRAHDGHARRGRARPRSRRPAASTSTRRWAAAVTRSPCSRPSPGRAIIGFDRDPAADRRGRGAPRRPWPIA